MLDGVDLSVESGERIAFAGPNGCGKSTLLRLMAGLTLPSDGVIRVDGERVQGPDPARNLLFQRPGLYPWRSVRGNVALGLELSGMARRLGREATRRRVDQALDELEMAHRADAPVRELSPGEQQRIALARSLLTEPRILLLDSPFTALDPASREDLCTLIDEAARARGLTLFIVSPFVDEVLQLVDRVILMEAHPGRFARTVDTAGRPRAELRNLVLDWIRTEHDRVHVPVGSAP